jgi:hypothetical protein
MVAVVLFMGKPFSNGCSIERMYDL